MSDDYLRLIPTSITWVPDVAAARVATEYVAGLFAGAGDSVDEVRQEFFGNVELIDLGVNTQSAQCTRCGAPVELEWVFGVVDQRADRLGWLEVEMLCCHERSSLNDLAYDWPMGFASFEITVLNASRDQYELQGDELHHVGALLGHEFRQILAHY